MYIWRYKSHIKIFPFYFPSAVYYECNRKTGFYLPFPPRLYQQKKHYFLFQNPGQKTCMAAMITNLRNFSSAHEFHVDRVCQAQNGDTQQQSNTKHYFSFFTNISGLVPIYRRNISWAGSIRNSFASTFFHTPIDSDGIRNIKIYVVFSSLFMCFSV